MRTQMAVLAALAVAMPALAEVAAPVSADSVAGADSERCIVSSSTTDGTTTVDVSSRLKVWQLMQGQSGTTMMRFTISPGAGENPPTVSAHAIKTKGMGGDRGIAPPPGPVPSGSGAKTCAQGKHIKSAVLTAARTNKPIVTKDVADFTCDLAGESSDPVITLHLTARGGGKATFQDLRFSTEDGTVRVSGHGPGGGPIVKRCDAVAMPSSDAAELLLPAVQK